MINKILVDLKIDCWIQDQVSNLTYIKLEVRGIVIFHVLL